MLFGLTVIAVRIADDPQTRYAKLKCQYRQIYERDGSADVAIIGTSRLMRGVDVDTLSRDGAMYVVDITVLAGLRTALFHDK